MLLCKEMSYNKHVNSETVNQRCRKMSHLLSLYN